MFRALVDRHVDALRAADAHHALVPTILANIYRDHDRRPQPWELRDFMLTVTDEERAEASWRKGLAMMELLAAGGGTQ
jgi:hypothetical protein